MKKHR